MRFEKNEFRLYKVIVFKGFKEVAHLRIVADSVNTAVKIARDVNKDNCVGFSVLDFGLLVSRNETPRVLVNENLN